MPEVDSGAASGASAAAGGGSTGAGAASGGGASTGWPSTGAGAGSAGSAVVESFCSGGRSRVGAVALAEDAALEQRVERLGRHEHELHLGADLLADRGESLLTRIGDGDDRPTRLDPERHGAHLPRVLRLEERVRLGVDRQLVPGTELELPLIGKCLRLRVLDGLGGARWDGGGGG